MRLYICGCISVDPDNYVRNFDQAEAQLRAAGYETVNPLANGVPSDAPWLEHMKSDIPMMLRSDAVATIDGWEFGRGTRIEVCLARDLDIPVKSVSQWVSAA